MSLDNITLDFGQLSFHSRPNNYSVTPTRDNIMTPRIIAPRSRSRNRQCIPSDDEEEEEEVESDYSSDGDAPKPPVHKRAITPTKPFRKSQPLPSDDESEDEIKLNHTIPQRQHLNPVSHDEAIYYDREDDDDDKALVSDPTMGPLLTLVEGSHLQQLHQMQQYHQAQLAQFQYHHQLVPSPSNSLLRPAPPPQRISMSGMDLLKQLEQEKADLKRQKPRLDTSKVKIEGLLGNLPEPGSHNISFQQIQQQNRKNKPRGHNKPYPYLK